MSINAPTPMMIAQKIRRSMLRLDGTAVSACGPHSLSGSLGFRIALVVFALPALLGRASQALVDPTLGGGILPPDADPNPTDDHAD